jgi:excisionase family DNA binding protein
MTTQRRTESTYELFPTNSTNTTALPESLLRPADVARRLAVSRSWVYQAAMDGRLPAIRLGGPDGPLRFIADDIDNCIAQAREAWRPTDTAARTLHRVNGPAAA